MKKNDIEINEIRERADYWKEFSATRRGERHEGAGMVCQDRVCYRQKDGIQVIALADGIGSCDLNVIGTERVLDSLCSFFIKEYEDIMQGSEEEIRYASLFEIRDAIGDAAEEFNVPVETFSSTILAVCINLDHGSYCSIHLGDGAILCKKEGSYQVLSYPVNGMEQNQTYLTTSSNILQEIRVYRGSLENMEGFALISDGIYKADSASEKLNSRVEDIYCKGMVAETGRDDQGIIGLVKKQEE